MAGLRISETADLLGFSHTALSRVLPKMKLKTKIIEKVSVLQLEENSQTALSWQGNSVNKYSLLLWWGEKHLHQGSAAFGQERESDPTVGMDSHKPNRWKLNSSQNFWT